MTGQPSSMDDAAPANPAEKTVVLEISTVQVSIIERRNWMHICRLKSTKFVCSVLISCIVGLCFLYFQPRLLPNFIAHERDFAFDLLFRWQNNVLKLIPGSVFLPSTEWPLVFIDIDDVKMGDSKANGELLPRTRVAILLKAVLALKPAMVVLDIDVSHQRDDDNILVDALVKRADRKIPIVIAGAPAVSQIYRENIREDANLYFGAVTVRRSTDQVVREFPLWTVRCADDKLWIEPSVSTLVYSILAGISSKMPGRAMPI